MGILTWIGITFLSLFFLAASALFVATAVYFAKHGVIDTWKPVVIPAFWAAVLLFLTGYIWFLPEQVMVRLGWAGSCTMVVTLGVGVIIAAHWAHAVVRGKREDYSLYDILAWQVKIESLLKGRRSD